MDNKGYTCIYCGGAWHIVDRYGKRILDESPHDNHVTARKRADCMNDILMEKRFK